MYGHAIEPDQSLALHLFQRFVSVPRGNQVDGRIVQLEQVDVVGTQPLERPFHGEPQVAGREVQPHVPVVEVAASLGREEDLIADVVQRRTEQGFGVAVAVHVRRVEEVAAELERPPDRTRGLRVVRGAVRVTERIATNCPSPETDLADRESGAAERAAVHASSSPTSCSGVETGIEHVVPTQTVAAGRASIFRTTILRGR